jgi:hypothetical protein
MEAEVLCLGLLLIPYPPIIPCSPEAYISNLDAIRMKYCLYGHLAYTYHRKVGVCDYGMFYGKSWPIEENIIDQYYPSPDQSESLNWGELRE